MTKRKLSPLHRRMVFTAGMGFFTDAYDLFIIGVVTAILTPLWQLSFLQLAVLNGAALAAAALGAVFFGRLADKLGRKAMYGMEILILFFGAVLSAFSPNYTFLLITRIVMGLGIGGDYPTSAVVASEYAPKRQRGRLVLLVFAMQAVGLIVGPSVAAVLLASHIPHDLVWRLLLGLGAIPAASVFYLRRNLNETPYYLKSKQDPVEVSRVVSELTGYSDGLEKNQVQPRHLLRAPWLVYLLGTAGSWFILDVAFYGNGISAVMITQKIMPYGGLLQHTLFSALLFLVFAVPGYYLAAKYIDKIGRKPLQMLGFTVMALVYFTIAYVPHLTANPTAFYVVIWFEFLFY